MAVVHFTTMPCKPNTANRHIESPIFAKFVPVLIILCRLGFNFLELFCVFMSVVRVLHAMNHG